MHNDIKTMAWVHKYVKPLLIYCTNLIALAYSYKKVGFYLKQNVQTN